MLLGASRDAFLDLSGTSTLQGQGFVLKGNTLAELPPLCVPSASRNGPCQRYLRRYPSGGTSTNHTQSSGATTEPEMLLGFTTNTPGQRRHAERIRSRNSNREDLLGVARNRSAILEGRRNGQKEGASLREAREGEAGEDFLESSSLSATISEEIITVLTRYRPIVLESECLNMCTQLHTAHFY